MAEYIEREKAFKLIKEQKEKETGAYSKGRNKGLIIAGSIINNKEVLPTADVVEVVHGKWKRGVPYVCSICGEPAPDENNTSERYSCWLSPHCPYCGAKMEDKEQG